MKKMNQSSKKLLLNRKVIIVLTSKEQSLVRGGSYSAEDTSCNRKSTTPGQTCPSVDCTTIPTGNCA